ncbi:unnamed protein product, partial [Prorocentrum cordatum]
MEGSRPGTRDMGVVLKVLSGSRAERLAGAAAGGGAAASSGLRRVLWRCTDLDRARRREQLQPLEEMVLPLLSARLPPGATALGVGASMDGAHLRLFVRLAAADPQ